MKDRQLLLPSSVPANAKRKSWICWSAAWYQSHRHPKPSANNSSPPDVFLKCRACADNRFKTTVIIRRNCDWYFLAHIYQSHIRIKDRIFKPNSFIINKSILSESMICGRIQVCALRLLPCNSLSHHNARQAFLPS